MNEQLAIMALDGLALAPLEIRVGESGIAVRGSGPAFRELARLCLLLGHDGTRTGESFELQAPIHLAEGSAPLTLQRA